MSSESESDEVRSEDPGPNPWGRKKIKLDPKKLTSEEKEYLGKAILAKKLTPKIIHERDELKEDTVRYYAEKVRKGDHLYDHGGRPSYLDKIGEQDLIKEVNPKFYHHEKEKLEDIVKGIGEETAERRGIDPENVKLPSARLLRSMKKNLHIKIGKGDPSTEARRKATEDLFNWINYLAMIKYISSNFPPALILNADATHFSAGPDGSASRDVLFSGARPRHLKAEPNKNSQSLVQYGIKYILLMSAGGSAADAVYIIADSSMGKEEVDVHEIYGLGIGGGIGNRGWIVFCQQRAGNKAMFKWYHQAVLLPFVQFLRSTDPALQNRPAWFQIDGEQIHLKIFQDDEMLELLKKDNIVVGKPPASTTELTQPCDVGSCFLQAKATFRVGQNHPSQEIQEMRDQWKTKVTEVFDHHAVLYPKGNAKRVQLINGIIDVYGSFCSSASPTHILPSFKKSGIHPPNLSLASDIWHHEINHELYQAVLSKLDDLETILSKKGRLPMRNYEKWGFLWSRFQRTKIAVH